MRLKVKNAFFDFCRKVYTLTFAIVFFEDIHQESLRCCLRTGQAPKNVMMSFRDTKPAHQFVHVYNSTFHWHSSSCSRCATHATRCTIIAISLELDINLTLWWIVFSCGKLENCALHVTLEDQHSRVHWNWSFSLHATPRLYSRIGAWSATRSFDSKKLIHEWQLQAREIRARRDDLLVLEVDFPTEFVQKKSAVKKVDILPVRAHLRAPEK